MNAVMARILGLAGSGGALRWAWTQGAKKINAEQKRMEMRKLPRRIGDLQMGRSGACLPQAGWAPTRYRIWRRRCWIWRCAVQLAQPACGRQALLRCYKGAPYKEGDYTKAEMPVMRSPMTSLWISLVPS